MVTLSGRSGHVTAINRQKGASYFDLSRNTLSCVHDVWRRSHKAQLESREVVDYCLLGTLPTDSVELAK